MASWEIHIAGKIIELNCWDIPASHVWSSAISAYLGFMVLMVFWCGSGGLIGISPICSRRGACRRRLRCRCCQSRHRGMAPRRSTCAPGRRRPHRKKPLVKPVPRNIKTARVNWYSSYSSPNKLCRYWSTTRCWGSKNRERSDNLDWLFLTLKPSSSAACQAIGLKKPPWELGDIRGPLGNLN